MKLAVSRHPALKAEIMAESLENNSIDTSADEYCAIAAVCAWLVLKMLAVVAP